MRRRFRRVIEDRSFSRRPEIASDDEFGGRKPGSNQPDKTRAQDDHGKGEFEKENGDESERGDGPHECVLEGLSTYPDNCYSNNRQDSRLKAVKDRSNPGQVTISRIN